MIRTLKKQLLQLQQEQKKMILENNKIPEKIWTAEEALERFKKPLTQTLNFILDSEAQGFPSWKYYKDAFELNKHFHSHNNSR